MHSTRRSGGQGVGLPVGSARGGALVVWAVVALVGFVVSLVIGLFVDGVIVVGFVVGSVGFVVGLELGLFVDGVIVAWAWWLK